MKFVVLALALFGVASAGFVAPLAHGYSGFGWGHSAIAAPAVTAYNAPIFASVAPAIATYETAPVVSAYHAVAPVVSAYHAAAPVVSAYHAATPVVSAYHAAAPVVSTYHSAPAVFAGPAVIDHGLGWGVDLWKKKKAAH